MRMNYTQKIFCKITRIHLNSEGYAKDGRYFGQGRNLYMYETWSEDPSYRSKSDFVRANSYQELRAKMKHGGYHVER